jgi:hypothetical protein
MSCILAHSFKDAVIGQCDGVGVFFSTGTTIDQSLMDEQDTVQLKVHNLHPKWKTLSCSGYLNQTVLQPQQKCDLLKGQMLRTK